MVQVKNKVDPKKEDHNQAEDLLRHITGVAPIDGRSKAQHDNRSSNSKTGDALRRHADKSVEFAQLAYFIKNFEKQNHDGALYNSNHNWRDAKTGERVDSYAVFAKSFIHHFGSVLDLKNMSPAEIRLFSRGSNFLKEILKQDDQLERQYGEKFAQLQRNFSTHK